MGRSKAAWTLRVEQILADGVWHDYESVVQQAMSTVPNPRASQIGLQIRAQLARHAGKELPDTPNSEEGLDALVWLGRRRVVTNTIGGYHRQGKVEFSHKGKGRQIRNSPGSV